MDILLQELGRERSKALSLLSLFAKALLGSAFLALMAQCAVPCYPVKMSLQPLAVFLLGLFLGSRAGALACVAYLIEGSLGMPVFGGGMADPLWMVGLKSGYLCAFPFAAYFCGKISEMAPNRVLYTLTSVAVAQLIIYVMGVAWLSVGMGLEKAIVVGVAPYLLGAVFKIGIATALKKAFHG